MKGILIERKMLRSSNLLKNQQYIFCDKYGIEGVLSQERGKVHKKSFKVF